MISEGLHEAELLGLPDDGGEVAQVISKLLNGYGLATATLYITDYSVKGRLEMERRVSTAELVVVIWTEESVAAPIILDLADIAARRDRLLNVELGTQTPIGYGGNRAEKISIKRGKITKGEFNILESLSTLIEQKNLGKPRRVKKSRIWITLLDFMFLWVLLFFIAALTLRSYDGFMFDVFVFSLLSYLGGLIFDVALIRCGFPFRNYVGRLIGRMVGQALLPSMILILTNSHASFIQIGLMIFAYFIIVSIKNIPYFISGSLRRRILA